MPGKKVLEHCSGLSPSEKELLEEGSGTKMPLYVAKNKDAVSSLCAVNELQ
jgi:hypothetical protein